MIFAAGLGTRLKPITDTLPKALVPIDGITLLEHVILKLKNSGFDEIILNVHHFPDQIINFLHQKKSFGIRIAISDERAMLLDTGGGIKKASRFFDDNEPFLVHNVDILSNIDLMALYSNHIINNALATLVVSERTTHRYLLFDSAKKLQGWQNIKTSETKPVQLKDTSCFEKLAFSGIQVLSPAVFDKMKTFPDKFSIIDFYLSNLHEPIYGYCPDNYKMMDVGKLDTLQEAEKFSRAI